MAACFGRRSYEKGRVHFGDGIHWVYPEDSCDNIAIPGEKVCQFCLGRSKATAKLQAQPRYPHGVIGEEIPANSQIYGGPWYKAGVLKWGLPAENDLKSLEEAKQIVMKKYFAVGEKSVITTTASTVSKEPITVVKTKEKVGGIIVAMELGEDPIIAEEVVECVLKSVTIKGVAYYVDTCGNVYIKNKNSSIGAFCGKLVEGEISV